MTTEGRETFERGLALVFTWCIIFFVGFGVGRCSKKDNTTRPVEEIEE